MTLLGCCVTTPLPLPEHDEQEVCTQQTATLAPGVQVNLESVQRLKCAEGLLPIWDIASFHRCAFFEALNARPGTSRSKSSCLARGPEATQWQSHIGSPYPRCLSVLFCTQTQLATRRWQSLTALNLSGCGLTALSSMVGGLGGLLELRLSDNKLTALPREIGLLRALRVLVADNNLLTALPGQTMCHTRLYRRRQ